MRGVRLKGGALYHLGMLTGREPEQRQIDQLLQQAAVGSSGVLVLRGDPGIGKTALVDYLYCVFGLRHAGIRGLPHRAS
jgi:tRNA A37 threonylcarbamoyladenosine biosynthesis protein TsaE